MATRLHKNDYSHNGRERKKSAALHSARKKGESGLREAPERLLRIVRHPYAVIKPSDCGDHGEDYRKPEKRVADDRGRHTETRIMQSLVHATRRLEHRPGCRQKSEPKDSPCRPGLAAEREKEQRRNRQQGKMRRQAVFGYGLLHFSTSGAYRPCRGSGRSRSCVREHCRRRTYRSDTQSCRRAGGSG